MERVLSLQFRDQSLKRSSRTCISVTWPELGLAAWWWEGDVGSDQVWLRDPSSSSRGLPDSPSHLLRFIQEVHAHYLHQRPLQYPPGPR